MSQSLPALGSFVSSTFAWYRRFWKDAFQISWWLVLAFAVFLLSTFLAARGMVFVSFLTLPLFILVTIYIVLRLLKFILLNENEKEAQTVPLTPVPAMYLLSVLWIGILTSLACGVASIALVLPAIWLGVCLMFSQYVLIEDNLRGTAALKASYALVKGRWWATFGRALVLVIFFGILQGLVVLVVGIVIGALSFAAHSVTGPATLMQTLALSLVSGIITMTLQVIMMPLSIVPIVKLFHALKSSR